MDVYVGFLSSVSGTWTFIIDSCKAVRDFEVPLNISDFFINTRKLFSLWACNKLKPK